MWNICDMVLQFFGSVLSGRASPVGVIWVRTQDCNWDLLSVNCILGVGCLVGLCWVNHLGLFFCQWYL